MKHKGHKFRRPDSERISLEELKEKFYLEKGWLKRKGGKSKLGRVKSTGYAWVKVTLKNGAVHEYSIHSLTFFIKHGYWAEEIDHDDNVKLNNHASNLKDTTRKANQIKMGEMTAYKVARCDGIIYKNVKQAANAVGCSESNIRHSIYRHHKAAGFSWRYA